jgi:predicted Zn-dependent protease
LLYPSDKEGLHYGSASKIIIIANKDASAISEYTLVAHLLPERKVTRINQALQVVNSLNLPPDEVFIDLDAIYMSEELLNETIEILKAQVAAENQNPTLYIILGDRYVQAWLPEQALKAYTKAIGLAAVQGKSDEEAIAKERLKLLNSAIGR